MNWEFLGGTSSYIADENKHMGLGMPRTPIPYSLLSLIRFQISISASRLSIGRETRLIVLPLSVSRLAISSTVLVRPCILVVFRTDGMDPHYCFHSSYTLPRR